MVNRSRDEIIRKLEELESRAAAFENQKNNDSDGSLDLDDLLSDNSAKKVENKVQRTFAVGIVWIGHTMNGVDHQEIIDELGYPRNP